MPMKIKQIGLWIVVGVMGRFIVHLPDATPLTALCLLSPIYFSKRVSIFVMIITMMLSDFVLHIFMHYPLYGLWTVFTYSGWLCVILLGTMFAARMTVLCAAYLSVFGALFFWMWTNFGTWMTTTLYPHSFAGLLACYVAALPFLRNSMIASVMWTSAIMWVVAPPLLKKSPRLL